MREIARRIGRPASTVSRELARNSTGQRSGVPGLSKAQAEADRRAGRPKQRRLATNLPLRKRCRNGWRRITPRADRPAVAAGVPDDPEMWVSHETIYQSLYVQGRGGLRRELTTYLRTGRTLRNLAGAPVNAGAGSRAW